jgi:hypothetical protein
LASFWSSSAILALPLVMSWCGADAQRERFVASVWLGTPVAPPPTPPRQPLANVVRWR